MTTNNTTNPFNHTVQFALVNKDGECMLLRKDGVARTFALGSVRQAIRMLEEKGFTCQILPSNLSTIRRKNGTVIMRHVRIRAYVKDVE